MPYTGTYDIENTTNSSMDDLSENFIGYKPY